ncbi:ABC transporter permease [Blautia sp. MSJ-19]|uniref:ABC transporter permease n=1 Tax=Blautia sp. MSJ-19 TaxID=2841517 RepID=UPI001C0F279D|nr:ABC transporter permease [Blautia sp. MSJ-19]MBU5479827.1 ABC transporter permease [Blautia sp. MSJ-19]
MFKSKEERYAGRLEQTKVYLGKLFRIFIYEKDWKVLPMASIIAAMVSYVVGKNMFVNMEGTKVGALAFVCVCIWNGFFNSIQVVCRERSVIKREHRSGMSIFSYLSAHVIYQAIICALQVAISLVVYWLMKVKFPTEGVVTGSFLADIFITLFLITFAADMMALMVSCLVHTTTTAMTVMPFLLIVQLVFAGVAFPLHGFPETISNASISKWGIYAVCTESNYNNLPTTVFKKSWKLLKKSEYVKELEDLGNKIDPAMVKDLEDEIYENLAQTMQESLQVEEYETERANVLREWALLFVFAVAYAGIGVLALEFVDKDKR